MPIKILANATITDAQYQGVLDNIPAGQTLAEVCMVKV